MSEKPKAESFHAIVRTLSAGVFAGEIDLFGVIEVIPTTDKARKAIEEVPIWTA